jgi:hypothetical protein
MKFYVFSFTRSSCSPRFLYTLFVALDACFRLKHRLVSSEAKDPGLGTGLSYFVEDGPYREYLLTVTDQNKVFA